MNSVYRNKINGIFFILLFLSFHLPMLAQEIPGDIPSPTAASLLKFGDVPMSLYTGTPKISIPIYEMKSLDMSMPISLDYDASGVQMNVLPSWTGHNWTLLAGGVITRQVVGHYDEFIYPRQAKPMNDTVLAHKCCYFKNYRRLKKFMEDKKEDGTEIYGDFGPDIFAFSFMGHSGKFFLGTDGQWKVLSDENLEVILDINELDKSNSIYFAHTPFMYPKSGTEDIEPKTIKGITIRDDAGNVYDFGYSKNAIEYTHSFFDMSNVEDIYAWHASSWYLTNVSDKYGNVLFSLSYDRGPYVIQAYNAFSLTYYNEHTKFGDFPSLNLNSHSYHFNDEFPYGFTITSPIYLRSITNRAGVVAEFNSSNNPLTAHDFYAKLYNRYGAVSQDVAIQYLYKDLAKRVSKWAIGKVNNYGTPYSSFYEVGAFAQLQSPQFKHYVDTTNTNYMDVLAYSRLRKLDNVKIYYPKNKEDYINYNFVYEYDRMHLTRLQLSSHTVKAGTVNDGCYQFKYNGIGLLPTDYLTTETDHWGYYNHKEVEKYPGHGVSNVDELKKECDSFSQQKSPHAYYSTLGILKEIIYPTGGTTQFGFEPNDYSKYLADNRQSMVSIHSNMLGGGVRLKSIINWQDISHQKMLKKTDYKYKDPVTKLSSGELFALPKYYWPQWKVITEDNSYTSIMAFRTSSIIPLSNSNGLHLGYSYVEEIDSVDGGKTVYQFKNISSCRRDTKFDFSYQDISQLTPVDEFTVKGLDCGRLKSKRLYTQQGKLVKSMGFKYSDVDESYAVYTSKIGWYFGKSAANNFKWGGVYRLLYPKIKLVESVDTLYSEPCYQISKKFYTYKDESVKLTNPYIHQADAKLLVREVRSNGMASERKDYTYPNCSEDTPEGAQGRYYHNLQPLSVSTYCNNSFVEKKQTRYERYYRTVGHMRGSTDYVPKYVVKEYLNGIQDTVLTYNLYSYSCMLQQYTLKGHLPTYIVWGYGDSYPITIQEGGQSLNPYLYSDNLYNKNLRNPLDYADEIRKEIIKTKVPGMGYIYNPLYGIVEIISANGDVTYYEYDGMGRLSAVYDKNKKCLQHYTYSYTNKY